MTGTVAPTVSAWEAAEIEAQRWLDAARRAVANGIRVYQITGCGSWVASSGSKPHAAHRLQVSNGVCHGCDCAGHDFTKVCQHRAAFYLMTGALPVPEPKHPKTAAAPRLLPAPIPFRERCSWCCGAGQVEEWGVSGPIGGKPCPDCAGSGRRAPVRAAG